MNQQKDYLTPAQKRHVEQIEAYLQQQTPDVLAKLKTLLARFNFDNLPSLSEQEQRAASIEFWYGIGSYSMSSAVMSEEWEELYNSYPEVFFDDWQDDKAIQLEQNEHVDRNRYYHLYDGCRETLYYRNIEILLHSWFAHLWQQAGGHLCGLRSVTVQNNSVRTFDLIACHWEENVQDWQPAKAGVAVPYPFNRPLNKLEIETRVGLLFGYSAANQWYYFEKDDEFLEIGVCHAEIGKRRGKLSERRTKPLHFLAESTNINQDVAKALDKAILDGFEQKLRPPNMPQRLTDTSYVVRDVSLVNSLPRFWEQDVLAFEQAFQCKLPNSFIGFLRIHNGGVTPNDKVAFPLSQTNWQTLQYFFGLGQNETLGLTARNQILLGDIPSSHIAFGQDMSANLLLLRTAADQTDEVVYWDSKRKVSKVLTPTFEEFGDSFFDSYFIDDEVTFFAKKNDSAQLLQKIKDGWPVDSVDKEGQTALKTAINANAHDVIRALLMNGASTEDLPHHWPQWIDAQTNQLLAEYRTTNKPQTPSLVKDIEGIIHTDTHTIAVSEKDITSTLERFQFITNGVAVEAYITQLEEQIGNELPTDYRQFLLQANGGLLTEAWLQINPNGSFPIQVLEFYGATGHPKSDLLYHYQQLQERAKLIHNGQDLSACLPIAMTNPGVYLVLQYERDEWTVGIEKQYEPTSYWPGVGYLQYAKMSFTELISRLKTSPQFLSVIERAIFKGDTDTLDAKLKQGWQINSPLPNGGYPLAWAIYFRNVDLVRYLVDNEANVEYSSGNGLLGYKPLIVAVGYGTPEIVEYLIYKGAGTNRDSHYLWHNAIALADYLIKERNRVELISIFPLLQKLDH
ncbi:MAG: hypothetical protein EAZ91_26115 [Cytophagales bacterium]|nr:MAG: hypothetical protein EAZ91_26115 [Cytophagales bacterium]